MSVSSKDMNCLCKSSCYMFLTNLELTSSHVFSLPKLHFALELTVPHIQCFVHHLPSLLKLNFLILKIPKFNCLGSCLGDIILKSWWVINTVAHTCS